MRTLHFRRAARTAVLGTAAMVAALSLTACQSDGPANAAGPDGPTGTAAPQPGDGTSAAPASDTDARTSEGPGSSGSVPGAEKDSGSTSDASSGKQPQDAGKGGSGGSGGSLPACTGANTKLTITSVKRPVNHMLLTVTNTGSKSCYAYSYPFLKFGEAQSVPRAFEDSVPQSVVVVSPGRSAYTGVMTSSADGSGTGGYSTAELSVGFQNADGESEGDMVDVPLGKEVHVDSTLAVTYWQTSMDDALMY
ncbi:DUF4232 domain-containing protein [Streptomyces sp. NPDC056796]|uniref:DUF4232 domain-containing protein n=1 Tax=Streptomyces sp. NPDC056796 TaxID=3345947 RepID=UPI0036859E71